MMPCMSMPLGVLIDIFCYRYKLRARPLNREVDLDVVNAVTCQSVDFVDDDVVARLLLQELEHSPQFRTIRGTCRLTGIDEFGYHDRVKRFGALLARITLRRYRKPLGFAAALSLVLGRHP